jgi:UDP-N-acetylmuramoyl-L-alanyl-D-glutamate--2,6-diaminopimelate ligase
MGAVAGGMADFVVVTSDNPRTEDPLAIITEILPGLESSGKTSPDTYVVIPDRAQAIAEALAMARAGDFVLLAGKGHEDYQILGTERIHFDDREEALKALQGRN